MRAIPDKTKDSVPARSISEKTRFDFIDALRAIAVLLVFARHATEVFLPYGHGNRLIYAATGWLNFGALGVSVFFAISGFLIPSSLHGSRLPGTVKYVLSRVFRLYPAFIISVIPSAAAHFWLGGRSFPFSEVLLNFTMVPRLFGGEMANGAYWTLEVEVAFYVLCLFLFVGGILTEAFTFAAICLGTFLVFQSSQQPFFGGIFNPTLTGPTFFFNMDIAIMCWGAVCRTWWSGQRLNLATGLIFWGFASFWIVYRPLVLAAAVFDHRLGDIDTKIIAAYGLGLAIFLAAVSYDRLRNPALLWIGRISYSFYLLHGVAIHLVRGELDRHPTLKGYHGGLYSLLSFALALGLAQTSFRYIEQPGIRLGRRLSRYILQRMAEFRLRHEAALVIGAALANPALARRTKAPRRNGAGA